MTVRLKDLSATAFLLTSLVAFSAQSEDVVPRTITVGSHIVQVDGMQVAVTSASGALESKSSCTGPGMTYDGIVAFYRALQQHMSSNERTAIAGMVRYPLQVNGPKPYQVASAAGLVEHFEEVFTSNVRQLIANAEPALVFCRNGGAMLGDGVLWAYEGNQGLRLQVVNQ